jgi:hypothetical protein
MARPRKGEEKKRPVHLGFRVSKWVYAGLQHVAGEHGRPMSDLAYDALVAYLKRHGVKEPREPEQEDEGLRNPVQKTPPRIRSREPAKSGPRP